MERVSISYQTPAGETHAENVAPNTVDDYVNMLEGHGLAVTNVSDAHKVEYVDIRYFDPERNHYLTTTVEEEETAIMLANLSDRGMVIETLSSPYTW